MTFVSTSGSRPSSLRDSRPPAPVASRSCSDSTTSQDTDRAARGHNCRSAAPTFTASCCGSSACRSFNQLSSRDAAARGANQEQVDRGRCGIACTSWSLGQSPLHRLSEREAVVGDLEAARFILRGDGPGEHDEQHGEPAFHRRYFPLNRGSSRISGSGLRWTGRAPCATKSLNRFFSASNRSLMRVISDRASANDPGFRRRRLGIQVKGPFQVVGQRRVS